MPIVVAFCLGLVVMTTVTHYEVLRLLSFGLPKLRIPTRAKLIIVIVAAFGSHAFQMLMYGAVYYVLIHVLLLGALMGGADSSLATCMYFSAETFTSLGFGDLLPSGPVRHGRRCGSVERFVADRLVGLATRISRWSGSGTDREPVVREARSGGAARHVRVRGWLRARAARARST